MSRKRISTGITLGLAFLAMLSLSGCEKVQELTAGFQKNNQETETELPANSRKATITLVSIVGNEITYIENESESESESEFESEVETEEIRESEFESEPETGKISESEPETEGSDTSESGSASGQSMPGGGEMPSGGSMPEGMEMPSGDFDPTQMDDFDSSQRGGRGQRSDSTDSEDFGENSGSGHGRQNMNIQTTYLPVGVVVYTDTGKESTFSILEAGDSLEVVFTEKEDGTEIITEIRMLGE